MAPFLRKTDLSVLVYHRLDDSAPDFIAGISGGLAGEIVCHTVDDYGPSNDIFHKKPFVIENLVSIPLIAQKGRKVSGMPGVGHVPWIVVIAGLPERSGAVAVFMYMHAVKAAGAR